MNVLVTGANGFIGRNLVSWLGRQEDVRVLAFDIDNTDQEFNRWLVEADFIVHLAGVNRPQSVDEFTITNVDLTARMCERLLEQGRSVPILLSSSIQAEIDNPYGVSKRQAEEVVAEYAERSGAPVITYRLTNVFGKWCRPNYNSVVATFCHNIARDLPITISDPTHEIDFIHVDDVVQAFIGEIRERRSEVRRQTTEVEYREVSPSYRVSLGRLADLVRSFRESRKSLIVPDFCDDFTHVLYGTYLSYLETDDFAYDLEQRCDPRGCLAEFVKSEPFGQVFVSRTKPGITRGNHFHHTKTEKFLVLEGEAIIRFRHIGDRMSEVSKDVVEYRVSGSDFRVVDIPPGYTHSIENIGESVLVTLFWASEIFEPEHMDTIWEDVVL